MRLAILLLCAAAAAFPQEVKLPPASFTGTVKTIESGTITLARPDQDDLEIVCTRKTHYYSGSKKIKRSDIKPGDRVVVETILDIERKPEAVNVRVQSPAGKKGG
jgi:hypothetical protein